MSIRSLIMFASRLAAVVLVAVSILWNTANSADCQSQKTETSCDALDGCEWFHSQCKCATDVSIDYMFAVDVSGSIGSSGFNQEKQFLTDFVQQGLAGDARVGWIFFSTHVDTTHVALRNWTTSELVSFVSAIKYPGGRTDTGGALKAVLQEYDLHGSDDRQKVLILITDGQPCPASAWSCPVDVCGYSYDLKTENIRTVILGVGRDIYPAYVTCLCLDADTDYIPVSGFSYDGFSDILPQLQEITCPVSLELKLTEVKPQPDTSQTYGSRFVEVYNSGSALSASKLQFGGLVTGTLPASLQIAQGQYLVLYETSVAHLNVSCVNCECNPRYADSKLDADRFMCADSVYVACFAGSEWCSFSSSMHNSDWHQQLNDTSSVASGGSSVLIDAVAFGEGGAAWPQLVDGYTLELKQVALDEHVGSNWQQSCYSFGTPGDAPIVCHNVDCSSETCQRNGDDDAVWNVNAGTDGECVCSDGFYRDACTCSPISDPSNCLAERVKNGSGSTPTWFMRYSWQAAGYVGDNIEYELSYWNQNTDTTKVTSIATVTQILEYDWENRGATQIAGLVRTVMNGVSYGATVECTVVTQVPTVSPTAAPTVPPTNAPTTLPTLAPTLHLPWFFIGGDVCEFTRCECAEGNLLTDALCCKRDEDACETAQKWYTSSDISTGADDDGSGDVAKYITVQSMDLLGNFYAPLFESSVYYRFEYVGVVNASSNANTTANNGTSTEAANRRRSLIRIRDTGNTTVANDSDVVDTPPMLITPSFGKLVFDDESSNARITFYIKSVAEADETRNVVFRLTLLNCSSEYSLNALEQCRVVFPDEYLLYVPQVESTATFISWYERSIAPYLGWLIAALAASLVLIAAATYWFWRRTRIQGAAIKEADEHLQQLIEEDELGMAPDLNQDKIGYNPLALAAARKAKEAQIGNGGASEIPKAERANVMVEKFEERQQYGQNTGNTVGKEQMVMNEALTGYTAPKLPANQQ